MERDPDLRPAVERHEQIQELGPERDVHWAVDNLHQEGVELKETDLYTHPLEFEKELADVQLALWTVLVQCGISQVEFYERILPRKADLVIRRMIDARILSRNGAMRWQDAYDGIKSLERT